MDLFNLFGKLTLDKESYEQGLKNASKLTKQQASNIKATFDDMSKKNVQALKDVIQQLERGEISLEDYRQKVEQLKKSQMDLDLSTQEFGLNSKKGLGLALAGWGAVAVAVAGVTKLIYDQMKGVIDYSNRVGDLAEKWGFTNREIQEFDYWTAVTGNDLETFLSGMESLVSKSRESIDVFNELGVSVKNNDGTFKNQKQLFLDTITALQGIEDVTYRNAIKFDLFGGAGVELGNIFNKTAEELEALSEQADRLGVFISDDAITKATKYNEQITILKKQWQGLLGSVFAGEEDADEKMDLFLESLQGSVESALPKIGKIGVVLVTGLIKGVAGALPELIRELADAIFSINWAEIGWQIIQAILEGAWEGLKNSFLWSIGKGWLWGFDDGENNEIKTSQSQISTITNTGRIERTEKVDETLDITLRVESDGTEVSEKNLEVVSDLVVQKINTILGGEL